MTFIRIVGALLGSAAFVAAAATAQTTAPLPAPTLEARDTPYPGTLTLDVDARDAAQGIFTVHETIPVAGAGPLTLLYPEWKPGNHAPSGQIRNLAGLRFSAGGKPIAWTRDTVDVFAFHLDVPEGAKSIDAEFDYLSPLDQDSGDRKVIAPTMLNLEWDAVSLYPAGYYVRDVKVKASATYPAGWTAFSALPATKSGSAAAYQTVGYDILTDSPVFAGLYTKKIALDPAMSLDLVADTPEELAITPEQIGFHKALVTQADRLFGTRHYDHYDLLVALSDYQSGEGLEHHRSSENSLDGDLFTDWDKTIADHYVVAHEYTHSWNSKFRRPFDLWTPDYHTPMQDSLLWVYEGQTQFWGDVLAARSGLWTRQQFLDILANVAAGYTEGTPGTRWRPLQDTTNDPIVTNHGDVSAWPSWSRGFDYYRNSELIWLEADQKIRALSHGARGLDDFAKLFFGVEPGQWDHELTYDFDDIVTALNAVQPYDWKTFLRARLDATDPATTLAGIAAAGYRLVFTDTPSATSKAIAGNQKSDSFTYSIGLTIDKKGKTTGVLWDSPAFKAGLHPEDVILAVNGIAYDADKLAAAIAAARTAGDPIALLVQNDDRFRTVSIDYHAGLRYPHLEKTVTGEAGLDRLIAAR